MTQPEDNIARQRLQQLIAHVRGLVDLPDGPDDVVDRVLTVLTLLAAAGVVGWPRGRKLPPVAANVTAIAREVWKRRHLWIPGAAPEELR